MCAISAVAELLVLSFIMFLTDGDFQAMMMR